MQLSSGGFTFCHPLCYFSFMEVLRKTEISLIPNKCWHIQVKALRTWSLKSVWFSRKKAELCFGAPDLVLYLQLSCHVTLGWVHNFSLNLEFFKWWTRQRATGERIPDFRVQREDHIHRSSALTFSHASRQFERQCSVFLWVKPDQRDLKRAILLLCPCVQPLILTLCFGTSPRAQLPVTPGEQCPATQRNLWGIHRWV